MPKFKLTAKEAMATIVFLYAGVILGRLIFTLVHEGGHFLTAFILNREAILGVYFPIENILKNLFFQEMTPLPECPDSTACVKYDLSVLESFGLVGGFLTYIAGVVATTALLFLSLRVKNSVQRSFNREKTVWFAITSFLAGWFLSGFEVSLGWGADGAKAVFLFIPNITVALLLVLPICLALAFVCVFAILDMAVLPFPIVSPAREELKALALKYKAGFLIQ